MLKISIYGIGNFGFALLKHLSSKKDFGVNFSISAYDENEKLMGYLQKNRTHLLHHKDIKISNQITLSENPQGLINDTDIIILAVTSDSLPQIAKKIKRYANKKIIIVNTAKALDPKTGMRPSKIICRHLPAESYSSIAMLAGGTVAGDLLFDSPLGVDIAATHRSDLARLKNIFESDNLHVYTSLDITGVEYAATLKSVVAILAGIARGLQFTYGAQTYLISRAAGEVENLVVKKLGGKKSTFSMKNQSWGNDLWMSCTTNTRNRQFGILIGKGYSAKSALQKMRRRNQTVEGINTVEALSKILARETGAFPILGSACKIILNTSPPRETLLYSLMSSRNI